MSKKRKLIKIKRGRGNANLINQALQYFKDKVWTLKNSRKNEKILIDNKCLMF